MLSGEWPAHAYAGGGQRRGVTRECSRSSRGDSGSSGFSGVLETKENLLHKMGKDSEKRPLANWPCQGRFSLN